MATQLLKFGELSEIGNRAIAANLAPPPRDALFFGIDVAVRSATYSNATPHDALKIEVDRLNSYIDPVGSEGYLLAMWLINAANKLAATRAQDASFFRDWAQRVNAIPPPAPAIDRTIENLILDVRAGEGANQSVSQAVQSLRASIPGVNRRATNLMVSKRLHDALHHIQLYIVPLWSTGVASLSASPGIARSTVKAQQRQLRDKSGALPGEFSFLPADDSLRKMAQKTTDDLLAAASYADVALAASDLEGLKSAISKVRAIVKEMMPVYALKMEGYQEGLELSELVVTLTGLAEGTGEDSLKASARRLASSLAAIIQDANVIGPQHRQWQLLDLRLGTLENFFAFLHLHPDMFSSFNLEWEAVDAAIDALAGSPPAARFNGVRSLRDQFLQSCPVPVQAPPGEEAASLFGDFVIEVRTVFHEVDLRMKEICNQLREITNQLAQL